MARPCWWRGSKCVRVSGVQSIQDRRDGWLVEATAINGLPDISAPPARGLARPPRCPSALACFAGRTFHQQSSHGVTNTSASTLPASPPPPPLLLSRLLPAPLRFFIIVPSSPKPWSSTLAYILIFPLVLHPPLLARLRSHASPHSIQPILHLLDQLCPILLTRPS